VQSLHRADRLARFPRDTFALILIDEAHHAVAEGYLRWTPSFGPRSGAVKRA
jgi:superfamily II DNA or RNA helicase